MMAKAGEISYFGSLDSAGQAHAAGKPFTDEACGVYLMRIGALMELLPPPPAAVLDLGCGTGWTSAFLAQRGYAVTGVDIAADMIEQARTRYGMLPALRFVVSDYEAGGFQAEFDAALFFDSLHHAVDERAALAFAWRALRVGGICVTSEPGVGHANSPDSIAAIAQYGVTERDMPPKLIMRTARAVGFSRTAALPSAQALGTIVYDRTHLTGSGGVRRLSARLVYWMRIARIFQNTQEHGVCVLIK